MARRVRDIFDEGPPRLLPRILLLSELEGLLTDHIPPQPRPGLRRRLELAKFVARLMDQRPGLAAHSSVFDLSDSLATLMDEMQGEGVAPGTIANLDVSVHSAHFAQTQAFLSIVETYLNETSASPDSEARQRLITEALIAQWTKHPPTHPIVLAGSTASRGTTRLLAESIAKLENGMVVLPGFDFDMPAQVWQQLGQDDLPAEDHPQFRFFNLMQNLGLGRSDVESWTDEPALAPARNRLVSLALRPAPITDAWRSEGPDLGDLRLATKDLTLVQAETPRAEAMAIALRLREAAEHGQKAALITPDRMLTRQVAAALDHWNIIPDDSAGMPLHLSPSGRFLRHTAQLMAQSLTAENLLTLLKHPLTHSAGDRNLHNLNTQRLELLMRRDGMPFPDRQTLTMIAPRLAGKHGEDILPWLEWLKGAFTGHEVTDTLPLGDWVERHRTLSEQIAQGMITGASRLWQKSDGEKAHSVMAALAEHAGHADPLTARDYGSLLHSLLSREEVRDSLAPHSGIMIWGTLEARVQGADLVILGSLNDGTWPEQPAPDPWLNRAMRQNAGLLLPDRRIGLSAHDFQQAIAAPNVWITRAVRGNDAETVPSRWINRITNLMTGLKDNSGPAALQEMTARGDVWLEKARLFEAPIVTDKATRPAPQPPLAARPRELTVSDVRTLIRDPYAIYAKHVLKLRALGPLVPQADALLRGIAIHQVLEDFVKETLADPARLTAATFLELSRIQLQSAVPWPAARCLWLARLGRIADWFVTTENARQDIGQPEAFEDRAKGQLALPELGMVVTARADRIDRTPDGSLIIYDYKTGTPPSAAKQTHFERQLLIEAAMAEAGGFTNVGRHPVAGAQYIGLTNSPKIEDAPLTDEPPAKVISELRELLASYLDETQGYISRRAHMTTGITTDFDQLARFGEWDASADAVPEVIK